MDSQNTSAGSMQHTRLYPDVGIWLEIASMNAAGVEKQRQSAPFNPKTSTLIQERHCYSTI